MTDLINTSTSEIAATILDLAPQCFSSARQSIIEGAGYLHQIRERNLWQGRASSFGEYVENECQLSQGYASKLLKAYEHYVLNGGLSRQDIAGVDPEKLYLAIALPGTPQEQAIQAQTLSRSEIKTTAAATPEGECSHAAHITICAVCHKKLA